MPRNVDADAFAQHNRISDFGLIFVAAFTLFHVNAPKSMNGDDRKQRR